MKGWKKVFHENENQKRAGVAILILRQNRLQVKNLTRDKKGHYIMIKKSVHQEDLTLVNIYVPIIRAPKYIKRILKDLKGEIDNTVMVGDFNILLSTKNCPDRKSIRKHLNLNYTLDQMDPTDIQNISSKQHQNTHSSQAHMEHSPG